MATFLKNISGTVLLHPLNLFVFRICMCLILSVVTIPLSAQNFYWKNLTVESGLSHNTVYAVFQDSKGFMWFGTKDGLNRYDGHQFKIFKNRPQDPLSLQNNHVLTLYETKDRRIWVGTYNGVSIYNPVTEDFSSFDVASQDGSEIGGQILEIQEDLSGNLWFASATQGLYRFHLPTQKLHHYIHQPGIKGTLASGSVSSLAVDEKGVVWVGILGGGVQQFIPANATFEEYMDSQEQLKKDQILKLVDYGPDILIGTKNGGLKKLVKQTGIIESVLATDGENNPLFVRTILRTAGTELWIGTELGIYLFDAATGAYRHLKENPQDPYSLSDNAIYTMFKDREGGIWVGSYFGGLDYLPNHLTFFEKYYPIANANSISGNRVREMVADKEGNIWIGTEDAGLNRFDPKTGEFKHYKPGKGQNKLAYHNIHGLLYSNGQLWVSSHSQGLKVDVIDIATGNIRKIDQSGLQDPHYDSDIFSIYEDSFGTKWFGTISGVFKMKAGSASLEAVPDLPISFYYDILEDKEHNLWLSTTNNGLFRYHLPTGHITHYLPRQGVEGSLPGFPVTCLFEDSKNRIWIGTEGYGMAMFGPGSDTFLTFGENEGLPSRTVYKILEDDLGYLWLSTTAGLVRYQPDTRQGMTYTRSNGLLADQGNYKSGLKTSDGKLYFGSLHGFIGFDPKSFREAGIQPELVLTGIKLFNKDLPIGKETSPLRQSITDTDHLVLNHQQSSLSFNFAALGFTAPDSYRYAYRMEGLEKDWNYLQKNQEISYLNLRPGNYRLVVKLVLQNGSLSEEEASLTLEVLPPFYLSPLAYFVYVVLLLGLLAFAISRYRHRLLQKHRESIRLLEDEKEKELYQSKIEFFTNITHEIRTPLTLIKGPLELLLKKQEVLEPDMQENLLVMEKNANRLINLSNQLLDFRKTEKQGFSLNFLPTNLVELLKELHYRFSPLAIQKEVAFELDVSEDVFIADLDREGITKIVSNLISNALKNAESCVTIHLSVSSEQSFGISVCNDGKLIPEALREKIFEPFYQISLEAEDARPREGTGLGLPLARSLSEMHGGKLFFDSSYRPELNTFTLQLPVHQEKSLLLGIEEDEAWMPTKERNRQEESVHHSKPVLLLVEDNRELLKFLYNNLREDYHIYKANNGRQALTLLEQKPVDMVISDIMMPVMNGIELCKEIKNSLAYSHIPVILLTAKSNIQTKIEGMETGADVYIEKPFSMEYLKLQVKNLLHYRDQIRQQFANSPVALAETIAHTQADELFLHQVSQTILLHLADEHFGVNELADAVNMSQSSLLRKIKGVSQLTPNEYIRLVRLKKAAEILAEGRHTVSEVCSMVGFNSPSYFSKCFQKQFGELPKDYHKVP